MRKFHIYNWEKIYSVNPEEVFSCACLIVGILALLMIMPLSSASAAESEGLQKAVLLADNTITPSPTDETAANTLHLSDEAAANTLHLSDEAPDPYELVRRVETQYLGDTSYAVATMTINTADWNRALEMEFWSEGRDRMLARIRQPARERGVSTLKTDDRLWNYIPRIDRVMRIPAGLMGEAWMGSHMTNDDVVRAHKVDELYTLTLDHYDGESAVVRAVPKETAAVVWGKLLYHVELKRVIPEKIEYFDEAGELARTIVFENPRKISDRWVLMKMKVLPEDKPEESTIIEYKELDIDINLPGDIFSLAGLRRR